LRLPKDFSKHSHIYKTIIFLRKDHPLKHL
jgi:hypothetical protein